MVPSGPGAAGSGSGRASCSGPNSVGVSRLKRSSLIKYLAREREREREIEGGRERGFRLKERGEEMREVDL
jgi:hypothetical protein